MTSAPVAGTHKRLTLGPLEVLPGAYRASLDGRELELTPTQIDLLTFLLRHQERVVSRTELATAVGLAQARSVDVALTGLRRLLGNGFVRNVRGRGWIIEPSSLGG